MEKLSKKQKKFFDRVFTQLYRNEFEDTLIDIYYLSSKVPRSELYNDGIMHQVYREYIQLQNRCYYAPSKINFELEKKFFQSNIKILCEHYEIKMNYPRNLGYIGSIHEIILPELTKEFREELEKHYFK